MNIFQFLINEIKEAIYPPHCIGCDEVLLARERHYGICDSCRTNKLVVPIKEPVCKKCGKPLETAKEYCADCAKTPHPFIQGKSLFFYEGNMREGMYRFKYSGRQCYARYYAKAAEAMHSRWIEQIQPDLIVPIPLYAKKKFKRGYNQADALAKALGKQFDIPVDCHALTRVKNTGPQKYLGRAERKKNLENAFIIGPTVVKLYCIMLVDDIYTTGSTMDAAARVLLDAGAAVVYIMTVCAGRDTEGRQGE